MRRHMVRPSKGARIRLNIRLPLATYQALAERARRSGSTLQDTVVAAIDAYTREPT